MKKLSIVIPHLNEGGLLKETLSSIYKTADSKMLEIITIDDNSTVSYDISQFTDVIKIINKTRIGVDACRSLGVASSSSNYCLLLDGHMKFRNDDWAKKMIAYIDNYPKTIWCTTCLGLGYGTTEIEDHKGKYFGADLKLFTPKEKDRPCRQVVEGVWSSEKKGDEYEISCLMGANYFFNKDWFNYIRALSGLMSWGSSEPAVSIKSYLSSGDCRITKKIEIGHFFRDNSPFSTSISHLVYNKLLLLKTIFPEELESKLMKHIPNDINLINALKMIEENKDFVQKEKNYYKSIFKVSFYDFCNKFNIEIPK